LCQLIFNPYFYMLKSLSLSFLFDGAGDGVC
jgi:hypothetical protein